jgi:hypothetical protein
MNLGTQKLLEGLSYCSFILKHLFRDTPKDPNSPEESTGGNSKEESGSTCWSVVWSNQRETVDEELPLTFSDTVMVRNFLRKAKKIWKKLC